MSGRPKKLAANLTRLECDAFCLAADFILVMPKRYMKPAPTTRPEPDPIWTGWRRCSKLAVMLHGEIWRQSNRLRTKAGLEPIPDPWLDEPEPDNGKLEPAA